MSRRESAWLIPGDDGESEDDLSTHLPSMTVAQHTADLVEASELEEERTIERYLMWQTITAVYDAFTSTLSTLHEREGLHLYSEAAASLVQHLPPRHPTATATGTGSSLPPQTPPRPIIGSRPGSSASTRASPAKTATPVKSPLKAQALMMLEQEQLEQQQQQHPQKRGGASSRQDVEFAKARASPSAVHGTSPRGPGARPAAGSPTSPSKKVSNGAIMPVSRQSSASGPTAAGPALSVKALQQERQRCEERKAALRSQMDHGPMRLDAQQAKQNSVLHRGPVQESRSLSSQRSRSPMAARASPVGVSAPSSARPVSPYNRTSSAPRSAISRTDSAPRGPNSARMTPPSRPTSVSRQPSATRSVSTERSRSAAALADPRRLPATKLPPPASASSTGGSQPNSARSGGSQLPTSGRSLSAGSRPSLANGGAPVVPAVRRSSLLPAGRRGTIVITNTGKATPRAGSNSNISAADFFVSVLHCRINRSLEVSEIVPSSSEASCALQPGDLLLEANGKGISTLEHLRTTVEELYGVVGGTSEVNGGGAMDLQERKTFHVTVLRDIQCLSLEVMGPTREELLALVGQ